MAFLYIYSPSDFVTGLPDEVGAQADGVPTFTLTLIAGAVPTLVEITDDETIFDEVDATQELTNATTIDGTTYAAGTTINTAYDLLNSTTGHKVTSFHFGGDGFQQGAVAGLASTVPLVPGTAYTFDSERTSHNQANEYDDYVACFSTGSRIETKRGLVEVQNLRIGDMIQTADNGYQPLRLVLRRRLSLDDLDAKQKLLPVRISQGALGQGLPSRDMLVSPQHRFLINSAIVDRMFGGAEVLISAKKLTALPGIYVARDVTQIEYFHLVLDRHEIMFAEHTATESFYCGPMAIAALSTAAQVEMRALFPELAQGEYMPDEVREIPNNKLQTQIVERHERNGKFVLSTEV